MSIAIPKRSVIVSGHRTSISMEDEFWARVQANARARNVSVNDYVTEIDGKLKSGRNLSSALRLEVLRTLQNEITALTVIVGRAA